VALSTIKQRGTQKVNKFDIERGILYCNSRVQLAEYLGINRTVLWKYLIKYTAEDGRTLDDVFEDKIKNSKRGKRSDHLDREYLEHLLDIGILGSKLPPAMVKDKLMDEGYLPRKCQCCGFEGVREMDMKTPLLLNFKDGKRICWKLDNLEILCYNCYFIRVGDLMFKDQLEALELLGGKRSKAVYNNISETETLEQAKEYKAAMDEAAQEYEDSDDFANDIIAYKKLKK